MITLFIACTAPIIYDTKTFSYTDNLRLSIESPSDISVNQGLHIVQKSNRHVFFLPITMCSIYVWREDKEKK